MKFSYLPKPKITFSQLGQVFFIFKEILKIIFRVKPRMLTLLLLLNAMIGLSGILGFYLEKLILDKLVSAYGTSNFGLYLYPVMMLILSALVLSFLRNIAQSITSYQKFNLARYFELEVDVLLGTKISQLDIATIEDAVFKDRMDKIERESGQRAWQLIMPLSDIPNTLVGFLSAVGVIFLIHPLVALGIILISLPRLFVNRRYIKKRYQLDSELAPESRVRGWLRNYVVRSRSFLEQKILGISGYLIERMKTVGQNYVDKKVQIHAEQEKKRVWTILPITVFEFTISVVLIFWVIVGRITIGTFQLFLRSLRSAQDNLSGLVTSLLDVYEHYIYVSDLVWLLNLKPKIDDESKGIKIPEQNLSINFDKVFFKYRDDLEFVLKDINFEINAGEKIAIVGENGSGKSTLIKLIARFYDPNRGNITVSGYDLKKFPPQKWKEKLAILFQLFETYPFSARETIGYGDIARVSNIKSIKESASKVGINQYIESLPLKYETPLAPEFNQGVMPSIGQWQRLGLARMLFRKKAKILILDEPTSNIDPEGEEEIFRELTKIAKDKILIFVTQRFSTVRIADRIFVVDKGQIIEQGTHKDLIALNGKYARLYNLQAQAYK